MAFAEIIKEIRLKKGFSLTEISNRLGMERMFYRRIEVEKIDCPISFLFKIAEALEVTPEEIIKRVNIKGGLI